MAGTRVGEVGKRQGIWSVRHLAMAVAVALVFGAVAVAGTPPVGSVPAPSSLAGDLTPVHDPTMVRVGDDWYLFSTGPGMAIRRSSDLVTWTTVGHVFPDGLPAWVFTEIPTLDPATRDAWAPDISFVNGRWRLYWAVAVFGSTRAVIGLMTNATLDPSDPAYEWVDEGVVLTSVAGDSIVAIDPNAVTDEAGNRWLVWGSFWDGIFIRRLDDATGKLVAGQPAINLARRDPWVLGVEGAYVVERDGWWYLFVSFGFCCQGVKSTYSIHVGRSRDLTGPYVDRTGRPMLDNGGTTVTGSYGDVVGPGHGSVIRDGDDWLLVHHIYDRAASGAATLSIRPLVWDEDGWPLATDPGFVAAADGAVVRSTAAGTWHVTGYPEEWPKRAPVDLQLSLRADGVAQPDVATVFGAPTAGTWREVNGRIEVDGVLVNGQRRSWWWWIDPVAGAAIGRDDRSAVVRGARTGDLPVPSTITSNPSAGPAPAVAAIPSFTG
jgi:arabinan endo-1,5-alpha-L-arabinosidase